MLTLSQEIKGYIAGIVDGEGSIGLYKHVCNSKRGYRFEARITVVSCSLTMLNKLVEYTGIGKIYKQWVINPKWKQSYRWEVSPNAIRLLLPEIFPFLIIKKEQAELMMKYLPLCIPNIRLKEEELLAISNICSQLKALNKRGI